MEMTIRVGGKDYAARFTMGAFVRFEEMTGRDAQSVDGRNIADLTRLMFCAVQSAANADGRECDLTFLDFADQLDPTAVQQWNAANAEQGAEHAEHGGAKKK